MCLIYVAHECVITQADKKLNPALTKFMGPTAGGREKQISPSKQN